MLANKDNYGGLGGWGGRSLTDVEIKAQ